MRLRAWAVFCLLAGSPAAFAADPLGRLFFTPEQRTLLELARRTQATAQGTEATTGGVTLSGVVTRSDGRQTVWINGRAQSVEGVRGREPAAATIPLPDGSGQVRLRVGQTLDPETGRVEEGWRRPQPPKPPAAQTRDDGRGKPAPTPSPPGRKAATPRDSDDEQVDPGA